MKPCGEQIIQFKTEVDKYLLLCKWNGTKEKILFNLKVTFVEAWIFEDNPFSWLAENSIQTDYICWMPHWLTHNGFKLFLQELSYFHFSVISRDNSSFHLSSNFSLSYQGNTRCPRPTPYKEVRPNPLRDAIFENGASGVPIKAQKAFICAGMGQTNTLKSPSKGAPPSTPGATVATLILDAVLCPRKFLCNQKKYRCIQLNPPRILFW